MEHNKTSKLKLNSTPYTWRTTSNTTSSKLVPTSKPYIWWINPYETTNYYKSCCPARVYCSETLLFWQNLDGSRILPPIVDTSPISSQIATDYVMDFNSDYKLPLRQPLQLPLQQPSDLLTTDFYSGPKQLISSIPESDNF